LELRAYLLYSYSSVSLLLELILTYLAILHDALFIRTSPNTNEKPKEQGKVRGIA
jgi:hypothetical protein